MLPSVKLFTLPEVFVIEIKKIKGDTFVLRTKYQLMRYEKCIGLWVFKAAFTVIIQCHCVANEQYIR